MAYTKGYTFGLLGLEVEDKVTGVKGIVISVSFDLFGCIQALVNPKAVNNVKQELYWFDTNRLNVTNNTPCMDVPAFCAVTKEPGDGPADKPSKY